MYLDIYILSIYRSTHIPSCDGGIILFEEEKTHDRSTCKFKPTVTVYVLTSPGSMCSRVGDTVRWHMDVSGEGEQSWPLAQLPPSPSASVSPDLSQAPSPFSHPLNFALPQSPGPPTPPPPPSAPTSYTSFCEGGRRCCVSRCWWWAVELFEATINLPWVWKMNKQLQLSCNSSLPYGLLFKQHSLM